MARQTYEETQFRTILNEIVDLAVEKALKETRMGMGDHKEKDGMLDVYLLPPMLDDSAAEALRDAYKWIPGAFKDRVPPDPTGFETPIRILDSVRQTLGQRDDKAYKVEAIDSSTLQDVDKAKDVVVDWEGRAAKAYYSSVSAVLPYVVSNNAVMVGLLKSGYERAQDLYKRERDDLMTLASDAKNALDALYDGDGGGGGFPTSTALTMVGALATIVAGAFTFGAGGAVVAASFTMLAGVASAGAAVTEDPEKKVQVAGQMVDEIIENIREALTTFDETNNDTEDRLTQAFLEYNAATEEESSAGKAMIIKAPTQLTDPPGNDRGEQFVPPDMPRS